MFSLPSAIPPPQGDHQAATSTYSDTATQRYPTLQTVTAPEQFRQRGDWGFKRNFPLRSTAKTSTPYLAIKQVDSMEQVTDFTSASGHTLTLEKMQEMNVNISLPHPTEGFNLLAVKPKLHSVFEDNFDFTALDADKIAAAGQNRWKYKGPWLANLTHGEFQNFLKKHVRGRREEFRQVVREHLASKLTQEATRRSQEEGTLDENQVSAVRPEDVTDEQIVGFFRIARINAEELNSLISKFLDLAPIDHSKMDNLGDLEPNQSKVVNALDPYAKYGPPTTHPSAGLSYLRTDAYLENHPIYGPQKDHAPIKSRVLGLGEKGLRTGVGGFVANPTQQMTKTLSAGLLAPGGAKYWAQITSAQVDSTGRAILTVKTAQGREKMVQEEMLGEGRIFRDRAEQTESDSTSPIQRKFNPTVRWNKSKFAPRRSLLKLSSSGAYGA